MNRCKLNYKLNTNFRNEINLNFKTQMEYNTKQKESKKHENTTICTTFSVTCKQKPIRATHELCKKIIMKANDASYTL